MPRAEERAGHFAVQDGGNRDRDGVDQVEHGAVVAEGSRAAPGGHRLSLVEARVGDGDQLDARHGRENPRVVLAQVADAHDADAQAASSRPPAVPGPAVLAQMLVLDEGQQALHLGAMMTV